MKYYRQLNRQLTNAKKHILIIAAAALVLSMLLSGCFGKKDSAIQSLRVGTWKTVQTVQPFYYNDFISDKYEVEVVPFTNPGDMKTALLAGDLDLAGTTWVTAIMAASKGEPIKVVGSMCIKCSALVAAANGGINEVKDLKGKKIAYVPGTMHHILLLESLKKAGLNPDTDVTLVRIDFFDMGQALALGQIDAFCSGEPYPSIAVAEGYGKILEYPYYDESIGFINAAIITTEEKVKQDLEMVKALVEAHYKSTEYLFENREEWLRKGVEFGTEMDLLRVSAENIELSWDITPTVIQQVKNLAARMLDLGIITELPDIDSLIDLQFIEDIRKQ